MKEIRQKIYGNEQKVLFMRQMNLLQNDIIEDEVKVGFSWIMKTFFYFGFYAVVMRFIENRNNEWVMGAGAILFFIASLVSQKCTSKGCYFGIDCYFFSFYHNKLRPWEKMRIPEMDNFLGIYIICLHRPVPIWVFSNIDELAELISRNTIIDKKYRQSYIDYLDFRKRQGIIYRRIYKILQLILVIAIFYGIITLIDAVARPGAQ